MIVDLVYNENGKPIGWTMKGISSEDIKSLGIIRDLQFFGMDETAIKYAGRKDGDDTNPGILTWKQKGS
jgi:hypothetical protein